MRNCARWMTAVVMLLALAACEGTDGPFGSGPPPTSAQYRGLDGRSVAVVVSADEHTLYGYPSAPLGVAQVVSGRLAAGVPDIRLVDPRQIVAFQRANPYWETLPPADLIGRLGVERIVLIDVAHYSTHEPGNTHQWQGTIVADVSVIAADAIRPNQAVFRTTVQAMFPEETKIGVLDSDDATIQLGMLSVFGREVALLFHDSRPQAKK